MSDITQNQKSMKKFYDDISEKYDLIFSLSPLHKTFFAEENCYDNADIALNIHFIFHAIKPFHHDPTC